MSRIIIIIIIIYFSSVYASQVCIVVELTSYWNTETVKTVHYVTRFNLYIKHYGSKRYSLLKC